MSMISPLAAYILYESRLREMEQDARNERILRESREPADEVRPISKVTVRIRRALAR